LDSYTSDMCMQSCGMSSYARAMTELRVDVEFKDIIVVTIPKLVDECLKSIGSDVEKNLKNHKQAARGVLVSPKVGFKHVKHVFRLVSNKNNANTNGKKKPDVMSRKKVSNSNPFDALNSVKNDDDLCTNKGISKSAVERIDKIERQIIDGKLTIMDDDGNQLPKVASMENVDSNSEMKMWSMTM
ncbi:hypothetical protein Tco_1332111, partial [Tanacetum coccineum]